jgi:hypothetical protein
MSCVTMRLTMQRFSTAYTYTKTSSSTDWVTTIISTVADQDNEGSKCQIRHLEIRY